MKPHDPKAPKHSPKRICSNIWYMLKYTFKYAPGFIWVTLIEAFGRALYHIITSVLFVKYVFDAIESGQDFKKIAITTVVMLGYIPIFELFNKWMLDVYRPKAKMQLHEGMQNELYAKARALDQSCYDDPEFYNDFIWAIRQSDERTYTMMVDLSIFLNRVVATIAIFAMVATIDSVVAIGVIVVTVLSFLLKNISNRIRYARELEINPIDRKIEYVQRVFYLTDYAKELRQGEMGARMQDEFGNAVEDKCKCIKRFAPRLFTVHLLSRFTSNVLFDAGLTGYLIIRYALDPTMSLGDFSVGLNASWRLYWQINQITDYITKFNEHSLYVDKFRRFIEYEPKIKSGDLMPTEFESLTLIGVSFAYPFGDRDFTLKDLTLTVKRGEKIALVGYNGAGKTTLTKLLMRLYDPTEGQILYNGHLLSDYDLEALRGHIGAVFQDYKIFAASLAENVLGDEYTKEKQETVLTALHAVDFDSRLASMPMGVQTQLTREYSNEGTDLSGGEKQKVAISRVFAHPYDFIIMDEPSSALDPIAEYELNNAILRDAADKTVIFISHRLSTTRMADRIYMFEKGEIIEVGSHDELIKRQGKYAEMYTVQAEKYTED